ncbi:MAG: hypothetical protein QOJ23_4814 [Actinomycetota bacterium]|nr:hypothetical protein [Actinomycetota bacterium]
MTYTAHTTVASFTDSAGVAGTTTTDVDLLGRSVAYTDENGTITRSTYDQAGRLTTTTRQFSGQSGTTLATYGYDAAGQLIGQSDYSSGAARTTTYTYDAAGRLASTNRPNNVNTTATADDAGNLNLLTQQKSTNTLYAFDYDRYVDGTVQWERDTKAGTARHYIYDGAGRLSQVDDGATTRRYAYDLNSNRCSTTSSTTCDPAYGFDNADRITKSPFASSYGYDGHGNLRTTAGTVGNPSVNYGYDANDHATVIDDGATKTTETLSPPSRVLRRVVTPSAGGAATEDLNYGYDGPGDSPAYQINNLATSQPPTGTQPRASASTHNTPATGGSLIVPTPAGLKANDVIIAAITVRGTVTVSAPDATWHLIRSDSNGSSMQLKSYWKTATGSEPTSYTWTFSAPKAATGIITAYSGVDTSTGFDVAAFLPDSINSSTSIVAPSITPTAANERVIGLFATMATSSNPITITEPSGMLERGDDSANTTGEPPSPSSSPTSSTPAPSASAPRPPQPPTPGAPPASSSPSRPDRRPRPAPEQSASGPPSAATTTP